MTVTELIEELKQQPPDMVVLKSTSDGLFPANKTEVVMCYQSMDVPEHIHEDFMPEYPDDDTDEIRKEFLVIR